MSTGQEKLTTRVFGALDRVWTSVVLAAHRPPQLVLPSRSTDRQRRPVEGGALARCQRGHSLCRGRRPQHAAAVLDAYGLPRRAHPHHRRQPAHHVRGKAGNGRLVGRRQDDLLGARRSQQRADPRVRRRRSTFSASRRSSRRSSTPAWRRSCATARRSINEYGEYLACVLNEVPIVTSVLNAWANLVELSDNSARRSSTTAGPATPCA